MRRLFSIAFSKRIYLFILILTIFAGLLFTLFTQLEMLSLGIIAKKGPDVFELFGKEAKGTLVSTKSITLDQMEQRFLEIDTNKDGSIDPKKVETFLAQKKREGVVDQVLDFLRKKLPIEKHVSILIIALLSVSFLKALTLFLYRFSIRCFSIEISKNVRELYFAHLQELPMSFFQKHNIGALSSRAVSDGYMIADGINSALVNYIQTPFAFLSTVAVCFAISWKLSCLIFFGIPFFIVPILFIAKRIRKLAKQLQKKQESFSSVLVEYLSGVQTIKLYGLEAFSLKKYQEQNDAMASLEIRTARYDNSSRPILHAIGMLCIACVLLVGLWVLKLPLYEILFYCGLLNAVYEPIKKFAEENGRIQRGLSAADRLFEVLDHPVAEKKTEELITQFPFEKEISFQNVSFSYEDDPRPVLSELTLTIPKGKTVALLGATGSGKSTIISLLTRLFDPTSGQIFIDKNPLNSIHIQEVRDFFAVVPQRTFLIHDTVRENIRFGRNFTDQEILAAAKLAHADEFIQDLPQKYDTLLLEAGKSLSGGQQQRLAIARALIKKTPVLILDEATSALDPVSEQLIKNTLFSLKGKTTQLIIAHRLSTIEDADLIIVLHQGKKVGEGTKEELLQNCPHFQQLWKAYEHSHINKNR
jgi:ABC-type multidrug transport system fused ATPase/permease subunit